MALVYMDGFDTYKINSDIDMAYFSGPAGDGGVINSVTVGTTSGRFGGGALYFGNYYSQISKTFETGFTEMWMGNAFSVVSSLSDVNYMLYSFISILGFEGQITYNPVNGLWSAWLGNAQSANETTGAIVQANYTMTNNSWHWIETYYKMGHNTGGVQLWVDGVQVLNVSNVTTNATVSTSFYIILFGSEQGNASALSGYFDDIYIIDPTIGDVNITRLGDCRIETLLPTSDAGPNDGTPSTAGPHYAMVDESQYNSNTYVQLSGASGQEEVYGTNSLSSVPEYIFGIRVVNVCKKTDGGTIYGNAVIRSGSATAYGDPVNILSNYFIQTGIFEVDPNIGNAWVYETANAADVGFTITS